MREKKKKKIIQEKFVAKSFWRKTFFSIVLDDDFSFLA